MEGQGTARRSQRRGVTEAYAVPLKTHRYRGKHTGLLSHVWWGNVGKRAVPKVTVNPVTVADRHVLELFEGRLP